MAINSKDVDSVSVPRVKVEKCMETPNYLRGIELIEQRLTIPLSFAVFVAALGMLQLGYFSGVLNALAVFYYIQGILDNDPGEVNISEHYLTICSLFVIGGMIGAYMGGYVANRFGRKGGLQLSSVFGIAGAFLTTGAMILSIHNLLLIGLLITGLNCGLSTTLVPMYIAEIAPHNLRGGLGIVNQLAIIIGLLLSQVLSIDQILGTNDDGLTVLLGLAICPVILQLLLLPHCPESPRHLMITMKQEKGARLILHQLRASDSSVEADIDEMCNEEQGSAERLPSPLIIGIVMQLIQTISGYDVVEGYLFSLSDLSIDSEFFPEILICVIMLVITLVSIPLMDRIGRRTLTLGGLCGMIVCLISIMILSQIQWLFYDNQNPSDLMKYLSITSALAFVVFFAVGPASIPWMITAELFSQSSRPHAMSITMLVNWSTSLVLIFGLPIMEEWCDDMLYLPYTVLLAIFGMFTYEFLPETKKYTFEEIQQLFRNGNRI